MFIISSSRRKSLLLIFSFLSIVLLISFLCLKQSCYLFSHSHSSSSTSIHSSISLAQDDGLTNFLFLGIGGQGHQAPDLTDTIILASFNHQTNHFNLISIPRDLWVSSYHAKINTFYHYALEQSPQQSLKVTQEMFSQTLGLPIHYLAIIDFQGFVRLIDLVGGIDINVQNAFDDYKYPIPGKETAEPESARYEHLHFDKGWQHMDGQLALKFARSRHALGPEGSDFARSRRQQQVIQAFLKKIISSPNLLEPSNFLKLKSELQHSLITNLTPQTYPALLKLLWILKQNPQNLQTHSLVSLLKEPIDLKPYANQWVLIPKTNWQTIHDYIKQTIHQ